MHSQECRTRLDSAVEKDEIPRNAGGLSKSPQLRDKRSRYMDILTMPEPYRLARVVGDARVCYAPTGASRRIPTVTK